MLKLAIAVSIGCVMVMLPLSCARSIAPQEYQSAGIGEFETRHWIHSERLRTVMGVLEREALATWPQEVEAEYAAKDEQKGEKALAEARALAEGLVESTPSITASVKKNRMSEADRRAFTAQVDTLSDQASRLFEATEAGDLDRMRINLKAIRTTCRSCHERFRDVAGSMSERARASLGG